VPSVVEVDEVVGIFLLGSIAVVPHPRLFRDLVEGSGGTS